MKHRKILTFSLWIALASYAIGQANVSTKIVDSAAEFRIQRAESLFHVVGGVLRKDEETIVAVPSLGEISVIDGAKVANLPNNISLDISLIKRSNGQFEIQSARPRILTVWDSYKQVFPKSNESFRGLHRHFREMEKAYSTSLTKTMEENIELDSVLHAPKELLNSTWLAANEEQKEALCRFAYADRNTVGQYDEKQFYGDDDRYIP